MKYSGPYIPSYTRIGRSYESKPSNISLAKKPDYNVFCHQDLEL